MKLIPLTHGQFTPVDDADFESASKLNWRLFRVGRLRYAGRKYKDEAGVWRGTRSKHLGNFKLETEAARAYDAAALKLFGLFAAPNFPQILYRRRPSSEAMTSVALAQML